MGAQGLLHFDAHFRNLLTDGQRIYFTDFGLAMHAGFAFDAAESDFFRRHSSYDRCHTVTHLARWLVTHVRGIPWADGHRYLRDLAAGRGDSGLPESVARVIARHLPVAVVQGDFYEGLMSRGKTTPYPAQELGRVLAGAQ